MARPALFSKHSSSSSHSKRAAQKQKRRKHSVVPWIESPLVGADQEEAVFHQRHESNTIELFFDLFFAANLATFTAYHSITDARALWAYIGFFAIIWATWFQITLHDVRFARDSIYERACKTVQFVVFVGFALVGSAFSPNRDAKSNTNFRILCYTLVVSRALFVLQYFVVLVFVFSKKGYNKLYLPLSMNMLVYFIAGIIFVAMTPAFADDAQTHRGIHAVWWIVMFTEAILTIGISSHWRMLSFKKTHLVERMGLLTLIVIGEGAIGVTKTIASMMGKYGLDPEGSAQTFFYVLILILIWMIYFDNHPKGHYGTIRQQIWSSLHFVYHLCVVGVVEGSRQMALARYTLKNTIKIDKEIYTACMDLNLDGSELVAYLADAIDYFQLESKVESERYIPQIVEDLWIVGNNTGICAYENTAGLYDPGWYPEDLVTLLSHTTGAIYASLGMKLPLDEHGVDLAISSWKVVYVYYWSAFLFLVLSSLLFLLLIRKNEADVFDWVSIIVRVVAVFVSIGFIAVSGQQERLFKLISTPYILPAAVTILLIILLSDHFSKMFANWTLRKSGVTYVEDAADHGHEHSHDHSHSHDEQGHDLHLLKHPVRPSIIPLQSSTSYSSSYVGYNPVPVVHNVDAYSSYSSPALTPYTPASSHGGEYMPVNYQTQHH